MILVILLIVVTIAYVGFVIDNFLNKKPGRAVNISTNIRRVGPVLEQIINHYLPHTQEYEYIEPGAGWALVTRFVEKRYSWKKVTAVDISWYAYIVGRFLNWVSRSRITYLRQNVFQTTFPKNSLVYSYLLPAIIEQLYKKGSLHGCLVVSLTFPISQLTPTEVIPLKGWQQSLFVYDLRGEKAQIPKTHA